MGGSFGLDFPLESIYNGSVIKETMEKEKRKQYEEETLNTLERSMVEIFGGKPQDRTNLYTEDK